MHPAEYILEKYGYDGVKYLDKSGFINYIVFNENQLEYLNDKNKRLSLKEEIITTLTAYFWMDKNAKLYKVPLFGHKRFAADYLGLKIADKDLELRGDIYTKMLVQGFIRITIYSGQLQFEYDKNIPPNDSQMEELKNMSIENELWLYDDVRQRNIDVDEKVNDGFEPTSFGPNCASTEGLPEPGYYQKEIEKMRKMENQSN
jgi:hypothetical protein